MSDFITAVQLFGTMVGMLTVGMLMLVIPGVITFKFLQLIFGK